MIKLMIYVSKLLTEQILINQLGDKSYARINPTRLFLRYTETAGLIILRLCYDLDKLFHVIRKDRLHENFKPCILLLLDKWSCPKTSIKGFPFY